MATWPHVAAAALLHADISGEGALQGQTFANQCKPLRHHMFRMMLLRVSGPNAVNPWWYPLFVSTAWQHACCTSQALCTCIDRHCSGICPLIIVDMLHCRALCHPVDGYFLHLHRAHLQ